MRKFVEIVKDTAIYQIDGITETRGNREDIIGSSKKNIL